MTDSGTELRQKLALAYQILYMEGIARDDTLGHITARVPGENKVYVKPWGVGFEEVTPDNLLAMDLEGNRVEGEGRLHSEMPIHNEIYKARPDVHCVVHVHPYHATLLSSLSDGKIRLVNQSAQQFAAGIPIYESSALVRSKEQGSALAASLGRSNAVLLRNHGVVAVGPTIEQAMVATVFVERAAQSHMTVAPFGAVQEIPQEVASRWGEELSRLEHCMNKFEYWRRKLKREGTGLYRG